MPLDSNTCKDLAPSKQWRITDSILIDSEKDIVSESREKEKEKIVNILVDKASDKDLIVLPIVGMGGLGKTTFAQLVYNDRVINKYFQLQRWCCVSDDFDVTKIASNICQTSEIDREKALQKLKKEVSGKRYLIVLDDVWNEDADKWEKLKTCLKYGAKGSAILTTTRKPQVAQIMEMSIDVSHNLEKLHTDFLRKILQKRAFCLQKPNAPKLNDMVEKILDRCGGSPLAAKAFGSMLSNKTTMKEWKDVLTRSNICTEDTGTLPILKLSYDDLPSHLKQCFAFCAVFPKDYEIDVEILIQLWMAHDFIPLKEDVHLEEVGREIFDELTWRSFFEDVKQRTYHEWQERRSRKVCKIHDLMHDIALSVMGKDCVTIVDRPNEKELLSAGPTRHLFSIYEHIGTFLDDYLKKHSAALQTLLYPNLGIRGSAPHLSKYNHLRALQFSELRKLPLRPRHLQHLRYLDLSFNWKIEELPKEITILYNLQTLKLDGCKNLGRLPKDIKYMTNLRHVYTIGCMSLKCMPPDLRKLTNLQTLTYFVVGSTPGCSTIAELQGLQLGGELELSGLEYVKEDDAEACSLGNKEKLTHLSLQWKNCRRQELNNYRNVLDALRPHVALEFLKINSYVGIGFPTWVTNLTYLQKLTELHLDGCINCEEFPQFCQLKVLEVLVLKKLDKLQSLCSHNSSEAFPAIKDLRLENLRNFERWVAKEGEELTFPLLENVKIVYCPKLTTLPEAPKLKVMKLVEDKAQLSSSIFRSRYMCRLSEVELSVRDAEATLTPEFDQDREVSPSKMVLHGCSFLFPSIQSQPAGNGVWKLFGQLLKLEIVHCDKLIYWPEEEFRSLVSLTDFIIQQCRELRGPTKVKGHRTRGRGQLLPNLKELLILDCGRLTELFVLPPSLTSLFIVRCASFESILGQDDRELGSVHHYTAASSEHCSDLASTSMPEQSPPTRINPLPCLKTLTIGGCQKLRFVPAQLDALLQLYIVNCDALVSLDCLGDLPLLTELSVKRCKHLASVPGSRGNYSALREVTIRYCPAINMMPLYGHLQQRLNSLELEDLSHARSCDPDEGPKLWEPKSWKYAIPGRCWWDDDLED